MPTATQRITIALDRLSPKPADTARSGKKAYSEAMSHALAGAVAAVFADAGLPDMRPSQNADGKTVGQERRMAGGIGDKKVDVDFFGHIFELSLNMIEEAQAELRGEPFDKSITKRKKFSAYYSPRYATKWIEEHGRLTV